MSKAPVLFEAQCYEDTSRIEVFPGLVVPNEIIIVAIEDPGHHTNAVALTREHAAAMAAALNEWLMQGAPTNALP